MSRHRPAGFSFRALFLVLLLVCGTLLFLKLTSLSRAAWYDDTWQYRKKLTIDHTKVSGSSNLSNFPILVSVSDIDFSKMQSNGADLLFTDSNGLTKLDHEIEKFDATTKTLLAWVRIPTLSYQNDGTIYMYYGNKGVTSQENVSGVWDSSYVSVWHLDESTGQHQDSKGTNNSTSVTLTEQGTNIGKVGHADRFDGTDDIVNITESSSLRLTTQGTIEVWMKPASTTQDGYAGLFNKASGGSAATLSYGLYWRDPSNVIRGYINNGTTENVIAMTKLSDTNWHHLAFTWTGSNLNIYDNGVSAATPVSQTVNAQSQASHPVKIGGDSFGTDSGTDDFFNGIIDEVRVSNVGRSVDWLKTTYNTVNSPETFVYARGTEEKIQQPVLYFKFDEGQGTAANNSVSTSNTGSITNASWLTEGSCVSGKCLAFDGAASNVTGGSVANVQAVSFWVKPKTTTETLVDFDGGTHYISASSGTITATGFSSPTIFVDGKLSSTMVAGKWQQITVTTATSFTASAITIGKRSTSYLNGFVDEFKVYDQTRSATQVKADYLAKSSGRGNSITIGDKGNSLANGLVAYYKLDEKTGTTISDSSGNGATSDAFTGNTAWARGKYGYGLGFDGNNDVVTIPETTATDIGLAGDSYTVSAWFKTTSTFSSARGSLVAKNDGSGAFPFDLYISTNSPGFQIFDYNTWPEIEDWSMNVSDGVWHNIVGVRDTVTDKIYVYVDGVLHGSTADTTTATMQNNDKVSIGNASTSYTGQDFNGSVDEVRIYNRALSANEIYDLYRYAPGPVGWWRFDEGLWNGTASEVKDGSGYGNNGVATCSYGCSGGELPPVTQEGKYGKAGLFNGNSNIVDVGNNTSMNPGLASFTLEMWTKTSVNTEDWRGYIGKTSDWTAGTQFEITKRWAYLRNGNTNDFSREYTSVADGRWHHLAAVWDRDAGYARVYIDGKHDDGFADVDISAVASLDISPYYNFTMGGTNHSINYQGLMDDVKFYNYARTPEQIVEDMNGGVSITGNVRMQPVIQYKFDEGYGDTAYDTMGNQNGNLGNVANTCPGGTNCPTWNQKGKFGKALQFVGTEYDNVVVPNGNIVNSSDFSASMWLMETARSGSNPGYLGKRNAAGTMDWVLYYSVVNSEIRLALGENAASTAFVNYAISPSLNQWHHLVLTKSGTTYTLYIDGVSKGTATSSQSWTASDDLFIGSYGSGSDSMTGLIDDFQFFNFALDKTQISQIYNQGKSLVLGSLSTSIDGITASNSASRKYCIPGDTSTCNDPVLDFSFEEGTGTSVKDVSGHAHDTAGYFGTAPMWTAGKNGKAMNFRQAEGNYIFSSDANDLDFGLTNFSICYWIYPRLTTPQYATPIKHRDGSAPNAGYEFRFGASGAMEFVIDWGASSTTHTTTTALPTNKWTYLCETVNRSGYMYMYMNGVQIQSSNISANSALDVTSTASFYVGGYSSSYKIDGLMDDVRVYDYVRTPAQIKWDMNQGSPVARYKFDECQGSTAYNSAVGVNNDALGFNATIYPGSSGNLTVGSCGSGSSTEMWSNGKTGKFNSSLDIDGTDDYLEAAAATGINVYGNTGWTIAAWVKAVTSGGGGYGRIVDKRSSLTDSSGVGYNLYVGDSYTGKLRLFGVVGMTANAQSFSVDSALGEFPKNEWHHVAMTFNAAGDNKIKLYIDGKETGYATQTAGTGSVTDDSAVNLRIGNYAGSTARAFDGQVDDVRVYNYPLTPNQLQMVMNDGAVRF